MKYIERSISVEDRMNLAVSFIIDGKFDVDKLRSALDSVVMNNDIFRYTIQTDGSTTKYIFCTPIGPELDVIDVKDEKEASSLMKKIVRSHSSELQIPCWEFHLYRISDEKHIFFGKFRHSCMDGSAIKLFLDQLIGLYNGVPTEFPNNYTDYLNSLSSKEELEHVSEMQKYWEKENEGHKPIVDVSSVSGKACCYVPFFNVDLDLIHKTARKYKTSNAILFLYLCHLAVAVSYGVDDVNVMTVVNGRTKKEFNNTLGKFISGSHNRIIFEKDRTISDTFKSTKVHLMKNLQLAQVGLKYPGSDPFLLTYINNTSLGSIMLGDAVVYPNPDMELSDDVDAELIMVDATETIDGNIEVVLNSSFELFTQQQREVFIKAFMDGIDVLNDSDMTFGEFADKYKYKGA